MFSEFTRRAPNFAPTYYALGWLDIKLNRRAEARANLEHSVALAPGSTDPLCELAQLELNDGALDSAEKFLQKVFERDPRHSKANIAYGDILLKRGNPAQAAAHYETAIQTDP